MNSYTARYTDKSRSFEKKIERVEAKDRAVPKPICIILSGAWEKPVTMVWWHWSPALDHCQQTPYQFQIMILGVFWNVCMCIHMYVRISISPFSPPLLVLPMCNIHLVILSTRVLSIILHVVKLLYNISFNTGKYKKNTNTYYILNLNALRLFWDVFVIPE